ncbi:hypothetical protein [Parabacteroides sp. FAFU027]|uniref:hypothetical protein n=1 Tax=Parabacteroides sp. FAFU027 TaxID=2922715 RepID=UPI001FB0169E|nr:hypothetical protein [Parabacteroides sp. FAFU027]
MYKKGDNVRCKGLKGIYEILSEPNEKLYLQNGEIHAARKNDFVLKRVDGVMEHEFEPYLNKTLSEIECRLIKD